MPGIKGYTFYEESLTGPHYFVGTAALRLPLFLEKNFTWAQFNMQNLSLGGIFQFGSAIQNSFTEIIEDDHYKLSGGLECRLHGFSFFHILQQLPMSITNPSQIWMRRENIISPCYLIIRSRL